jgi:predicted ATPase
VNPPTSELCNNAHQREYITAIIGKNGTGKSHLLSAIVRTFLLLEEAKVKRQETAKNIPLRNLEYLSNGRHCRVMHDQKGTVKFSVDGLGLPAYELPLPHRIVALTISPFDKFPVPRSINKGSNPSDGSIYQYLGLRDRFGKASIENLLYRSLNSIFDTAENEALRRTNIGAVFDFLGYNPILNIIYRLRVNTKLREAAFRKDSLLKGAISETQRRSLEDALRSGLNEVDILDLLEVAIKRSVNGRIESKVDFEAGGLIDDASVTLQPIRRAGFMNLVGVEVTHRNGMQSDLRGASSGTLSMASSLIALASVIRNGSLVLIDEPELSLHPEWQVKYIDLLVRTFGRYQGCHFVVATHSPLVISELPDHAEVVSLDRDGLPRIQDLKGQSSDYLLAEAFGLPGNGNLHVKELVIQALRLVAAGQARSAELRKLIQDLERFEPDLDESDPTKEIIKNLHKVVEIAGKSAK